MDDKQLELIIMYQLCGVELKDNGLFYEKGSTTPFTGNKIAYDRKLFGMIKSKIKRAEISFQNGKQHGPMMLWHKNGEKWLEMEYYKGKPHSWRKRWFENGQIEEESLFNHGEIIEQKYTPNIQILGLFVKLYNKRIYELGGISLSNKKDKKSIESFLLHEYDNCNEKMKYGTGKEKKFYKEFNGWIDSSKNEIIEYIIENI